MRRDATQSSGVLARDSRIITWGHCHTEDRDADLAVRRSAKSAAKISPSERRERKRTILSKEYRERRPKLYQRVRLTVEGGEGGKEALLSVADVRRNFGRRWEGFVRVGLGTC
jgi:hypothetical protein